MIHNIFQSLFLPVIYNPVVIRVAGWFNRKLVFSNFVTVKIDKDTLFAKRLDRILALWLLKYNPARHKEASTLKHFIRPGWTIIDIGANLGYYTLVAARSVGREGHVIAFEPNSENFESLSRSIAANSYTNIELHQTAVTQKSGIVRLYRSDANSGDHRIYDSGDGRIYEDVPGTSLDDFLKSGRRVDLIKMDIQGAEALALAGMRRVIAENYSCILISEFSPFHLRTSGTDPYRFLSMLQDFGYCLGIIDESSGNIISKEADALVKQCGKRGYINLFLRKR